MDGLTACGERAGDVTFFLGIDSYAVRTPDSQRS